MMAITSLKMTGLVLLAVPVVLGPIFFFGRKVRDLSRQSQDRVGDLGSYVDETLHEIHTVQAYTHEARDRYLFDDRVEAVMSAASGRIKYRSILISTVDVAQYFSYLIGHLGRRTGCDDWSHYWRRAVCIYVLCCDGGGIGCHHQ